MSKIAVMEFGHNLSLTETSAKSLPALNRLARDATHSAVVPLYRTRYSDYRLSVCPSDVLMHASVPDFEHERMFYYLLISCCELYEIKVSDNQIIRRRQFEAEQWMYA